MKYLQTFKTLSSGELPPTARRSGPAAGPGRGAAVRTAARPAARRVFRRGMGGGLQRLARLRPRCKASAQSRRTRHRAVLAVQDDGDVSHRFSCSTVPAVGRRSKLGGTFPAVPTPRRAIPPPSESQNTPAAGDPAPFDRRHTSATAGTCLRREFAGCWWRADRIEEEVVG